MCGTLSRSPAGDIIASSRKRTTRPDKAARHAVGPSSLASKSICRPRQMPRNGRSRMAASTLSASPLARRPFMQSGMALWPGRTTRSASRIAAASAETSTSRSGATWASAFATERRLPMP